MARKSDGAQTAANSVTASKTASALRTLRERIDKLDHQILKLVNDRASLAVEIGRLKTDQGGDVFSPTREEEVLQNVLEVNTKNGGPLPDVTIRAIFREIMSGSRAIQKVLKVAYLGPEYTFSHLAAIEKFGQTVEFMGVGSIATVFEEVDRGHVDVGVVPVENSSDGRVSDTLDMFMRMPHLVICGEVRLRIHHHLMANCEQQEIRRVYSKPQVLSQCRNWLSKNVPQALQKEVSSTADAARLAQMEPGAAAVASRQAAVSYGLRILFEDIQDSPYNETRFAVIGMQEVRQDGPRQDRHHVPHLPQPRLVGRGARRLQAEQDQPHLDRVVPRQDLKVRVHLLRRFRGARGRPQGRPRPQGPGRARAGGDRPGVVPHGPDRGVRFGAFLSPVGASS